MTASVSSRLVGGMQFSQHYLLPVAWLLASGCAGVAPERSVETGGPFPPPWALETVEGRTLRLRPQGGQMAVVFEFLGTECPIANRVQPELERLARTLGARGVRFVAVYPNSGETPEGIRNQRAEAGLTVEAALDPQYRLTDRLRATVTPEVVAVASDGQLIYRGRVNDQFGGLGQGRPAPTQHDLEEALLAFLESGSARGVQTRPVGCRIQRLP